MSPLEIILVTFVGNTVLLGVLGFLARSLISQLLAKDLKQYENKLTQASDLATEEMKHRLSLVTHEHNVRFNRLHEKQAQVLEEIYALLLNFEDTSKFMTLVKSDDPEDLMKSTLRRAEDGRHELEQYIRRHEIYLPATVSMQLKALLDRVNSLLSDCNYNLINKQLAKTGHTEIFTETKDAWIKVNKYLVDEAPDVRHALEVDFRKRLGAETS